MNYFNKEKFGKPNFSQRNKTWQYKWKRFSFLMVGLLMSFTFSSIMLCNYAWAENPDSEQDTGYPFVFVEIPEKLDGDPRQPSSVVSPGDWVLVGHPVAISPVNDSYLNNLKLACKAGLGFVDFCDWEKKIIAGGYSLIRHQRYKANGVGFTVPPEDTRTHSETITVGSKHLTDQTTENTTGYTLGTSSTVTTSANMNAGLEFDGASLGGGISTSASITTSADVSKGLKVTKTDEDISTDTKTDSVGIESQGGKTGARYVTWQIEDLIEVEHGGNLEPPDQMCFDLEVFGSMGERVKICGAADDLSFLGFLQLDGWDSKGEKWSTKVVRSKVLGITQTNKYCFTEDQKCS